MPGKITRPATTKLGKGLRNSLHNHPLLGKGGVHQKSAKALRQKEKTALRQAQKKGEWPELTEPKSVSSDHSPFSLLTWAPIRTP